MSELDGLEEIDLAAHGSDRSAKRIRNGRKQLRKGSRHQRKWKTELHAYQTKQAKQGGEVTPLRSQAASKTKR